MRSTPNYFKFRQWLGWAMKDNPLGDDHFFADDVYQDNLLDEYEIIPVPFILSYGASMLEYARKYFKEHAYSFKIPVFVCKINDLNNYNPNDFQHDNSIPDFSTLEQTVTMCQDERCRAKIDFYVYRSNIWQKQLNDGFSFICTQAPTWFGCQYNMVYSKELFHLEHPTVDAAFHGFMVLHDIMFYHSDATDFYPFEMNKWYGSCITASDVIQ